MSSRFSRRWAVELRVGVENSTREYESVEIRDPATGSRLPLASTSLVDSGLRFGSHPGQSARVSRTTFQAQPVVHLEFGGHNIKAGGTVVLPSHDYEYGFGSGGEYLYSDLNALETAQGVYTRLDAPRPAADFVVPRFGLFLQDFWDAAPGFQFLAGIRVDAESLPQNEVTFNERWFELTGLRNDDFESKTLSIGPRAGFVWDVGQRGRTMVRGAAGVYFGELDPALLDEIHTMDRGLPVLRVAGDLSPWPLGGGRGGTNLTASRTTLFGPTIQAPETVRGGVGITQAITNHTALVLSGSYRRTDYLPRRSDLNLPPRPVFRDQFGRAVFGPLRQQDELLFAEPGLNRRFPEFDHVWALNPDGWSEYVGVTVGIERTRGDVLDLFASYTFSRTEDNWVGAASADPRSGVDPLLDGPGGPDWTEGRSDYDIPHRLALGWALKLPALVGIDLSGVYSFRSGLPFTPGFRDGVDPNGDGIGGNDPAFVPAVSEIDQLAADWSCLDAQIGGFAERNACRPPGVHDLDLRLSVGVIRLGRGRAELVVDALNMIDSEQGVRDTALLLVAPDVGLDTDEASGTVTVPVRVNPDFGQVLFSQAPGRWFRFGFRVVY
jgi:hypothetical protein